LPDHAGCAEEKYVHAVHPTVGVFRGAREVIDREHRNAA
jgi:hypothetical protein